MGPFNVKKKKNKKKTGSKYLFKVSPLLFDLEKS